MKTPPSLVCPAPIDPDDRLTLAHGGGGRRMRALLRERVAPRFGAQVTLHDGAVLPFGEARLALSTDAFVVQPLFFPGGDLGRLAVCGTVNDLAMCGARPVALSLAVIAEEGLPMATLDAVLESVRATAAEAGAPVVTGDTKVVGRGEADGLYLVTTGIGLVPPGVEISPRRVRPGDALILSGDVGRHEVAILSARAHLGFETALESDVALQHEQVASMLQRSIDVRCLRDPTRGGLAAALHEIAGDAGVDLELDEAAVPVHPTVASACEILGLDPLNLACEGRFLAVVAPEHAERALEVLAAAGGSPARVGEARAGAGRVWTRGPMGGRRPLVLPDGELLPRIC